MTSNIEKLNLIAPLLAGRAIFVVGEEQDDIYELFGLFHSLEIDDVYADSEPMVYVRATDVEKKRSTLTPEKTWKETWERVGDAELAFPVSKLESVEQPHEGRAIFVHFYPKWTHQETTLVFQRRH